MRYPSKRISSIYYMEARFYEKLDGGAVRCNLCERHCVIPPDGRGVCLVRENREGKLYTLVYGKPVAMHLDPIEKKPLFHFYPGSWIFSYSTVGCNFKCLFCQNWEISQARPEAFDLPYVPPERVVWLAEREGSIGIAHTYTEPTVYYEYARDIGVLAKERNMVNVWVTNGYFSRELLRDLVGWVDAMNIDLKGDERVYRELVGGVDAEVVKRTIKEAYKAGIHVEVTTLIIPGWNDDPELYLQLIDFLKSVSKDIPLHITRFFPHYKMKDVPPTPIGTLYRLRDVAREEGMRYVYVGNVHDWEAQSTFCPNCGALLIKRDGLRVEVYLDGNRCPKCGYKIKGRFTERQGSSTTAFQL